jgi:predicted nucleic acid-binding protein
LLLILDSNEYIFALSTVRERASEKLLEKILTHPKDISLRIPRLIVEEVRNNLTPEAFKEFILLLNKYTKIDEDSEVPFELGAKYEAKGLKAADAFIAAYTEWTGAEALVTENRHFLSRHADLPFKVLTAEACLRFIGK